MQVATSQSPTLHEEKQRAGRLLHTLPKPSSRLEEWKHTPLWNYLSNELWPLHPRVTFLSSHPYTASIHISDEVRLQPSQAVEMHLIEGDDPLPPRAGMLAGDNHWTEALNRAHLPWIIRLTVKENCTATLHLRVQYPHSTDGEKLTLLPLRLLLHVGENATLVIQEEIEARQAGKGNTWLNQVIEAWADNHATIYWTKIQSAQNTNTLLTDHTYIRLREGARLRMLTWTEGFGLCRNMPHVQLAEPLSSAHLWGLSLPAPNSLIDNHTFVEHIAPQTESNEHYRGVVAPRATVVFHGRIYVHQDAQQTNAYQQDRYILVDESSRVHSQPQLEIFADDVRCTHGAAIGFTDREALFYARARGIPLGRARLLLLSGFCSQVLKEFAEECSQVDTQFLHDRLNSSMEWLFQTSG